MGRLDWLASHQCKFTVDKFGIMGLTRRKEPCPLLGLKTRTIQRHPIFLQGVKVLAVTTHKFLGMMLDQELHWIMHLHYALQKGTKWVTQYCWLSKLSRGVLPKYMRQYFIIVTVPKMLYTADLFLIPGSRMGKGTKGSIGKLAKIQRQAALHVTRALKMAPMDAVDACTDILPFHLQVENLIYHSASRLAMLHQTRPFGKHITQAVARYVKIHRAPIHEIMHTCKIQPTIFKSISPCSQKMGGSSHF